MRKLRSEKGEGVRKRRRGRRKKRYAVLPRIFEEREITGELHKRVFKHIDLGRSGLITNLFFQLFLIFSF